MKNLNLEKQALIEAKIYEREGEIQDRKAITINLRKSIMRRAKRNGSIIFLGQTVKNNGSQLLDNLQ